MRITTIELAGTIEEGKHLPRAFARISRKLGDEYITVEYIAFSGAETNEATRAHKVRADDADDQWSAAEMLQWELDGHKGTNGDICDYFRLFEMLAD